MENEIAPNQFLIFEVDEKYAIELQRVHEIVELQAITSVPEAPPYIFGVMNLRGSVIPILDIRTRFRKESTGSKNLQAVIKKDLLRQAVIIVDFNSMKLGIIVDTVVDLATIEEDKINPPPQVGNNYSHVFIKAIGFWEDEMVLIVDGEKLVNLDDLNFIAEE